MTSDLVRTARTCGALLATCSAGHVLAAPSTQPRPATQPAFEPVPGLTKGPYLQNLQPDRLVMCLEAASHDRAGWTVELAISRRALGGETDDVPIDVIRRTQEAQYELMPLASPRFGRVAAAQAGRRDTRSRPCAC